jgi:hypothetical protein
MPGGPKTLIGDAGLVLIIIPSSVLILKRERRVRASVGFRVWMEIEYIYNDDLPSSENGFF